MGAPLVTKVKLVSVDGDVKLTANDLKLFSPGNDLVDKFEGLSLIDLLQRALSTDTKISSLASRQINGITSLSQPSPLFSPLSPLSKPEQPRLNFHWAHSSTVSRQH